MHCSDQESSSSSTTRTTTSAPQSTDGDDYSIRGDPSTTNATNITSSMTTTGDSSNGNALSSSSTSSSKNDPTTLSTSTTESNNDRGIITIAATTTTTATSTTTSSVVSSVDQHPHRDVQEDNNIIDIHSRCNSNEILNKDEDAEAQVAEDDDEEEALISRILDYLKLYHVYYKCSVTIHDSAVTETLHSTTGDDDLEDDDQSLVVLVATLQKLGELCGRMQDLSQPCQALLKEKVPQATINVLQQHLTSSSTNTNDSCWNHQQQQRPNNSITVVNVFLQGCCVLANLCYCRAEGGGDATQTAIGESGGVETILQAMKLFRDDDLLQQFACGALGNLLIEHFDNAKRLHKAGGIQLVVRAMETHPNVEHLQEWAFRALNNLCYWNEFRQDIVNAGGVTAIKTALANSHQPEDFCRLTEWALAVMMQTVQSSEQ